MISDKCLEVSDVSPFLKSGPVVSSDLFVNNHFLKDYHPWHPSVIMRGLLGKTKFLWKPAGVREREARAIKPKGLMRFL